MTPSLIIPLVCLTVMTLCILGMLRIIASIKTDIIPPTPSVPDQPEMPRHFHVDRYNHPK